MAIRIILADDQAMVRQGIKLLLERKAEDIHVLAEAADGREAVRLARKLQPDVAVLDLAMPLLNGLDAAREIRHDVPLTKTILLTVHAEDRRVLEALRSGRRVPRGRAVTGRPVCRASASRRESGGCCSWWRKERRPRRLHWGFTPRPVWCAMRFGRVS